MAHNDGQGPGMDRVAMTAIIVAGVVILACIAAFTLIAIIFVNNAPWS